MMIGINLLVTSEQQSYICFHLSLLRNWFIFGRTKWGRIYYKDVNLVHIVNLAPYFSHTFYLCAVLCFCMQIVGRSAVAYKINNTVCFLAFYEYQPDDTHAIWQYMTKHIFFILLFSLTVCSSQLDWSYQIEINYDTLRQNVVLINARRDGEEVAELTVNWAIPVLFPVFLHRVLVYWWQGG